MKPRLSARIRRPTSDPPSRFCDHCITCGGLVFLRPKQRGQSGKNEAIPSRASPLPQNGAAVCRCPCGSWLACDANNAVTQKKQGDTFASKPAPTVLRSCLQVTLWELACLRCKQRGQSGKTGRYLREQARSHRTAQPLAGALVGAGLPAMRTTRSLRKNRAIPSRASPLPQNGAAVCRCCCGIS